MKIEIKEFNQEGYKDILSFESWRVAMLNYIDELETDQIDNVQAHLLTDEVFVLLEGNCILFLAEVEDGVITNIEAVDMLPHKIYNIKKGVYHTHTLSKDGKVLIVENDDTSDENSPKIMIDSTVNQKLTEIKNKLWKKNTL